MSPNRFRFGVPGRLLALLTVTFSTFAQLPTPRLESIFPAGGQRGTIVELQPEGTDLEDPTAIHFSAPGISSERLNTNSSAFKVTISSNVPTGLYEARVAGRFGISNPRFFTIGERPELINRTTNQSPETAVLLPLETTVNTFVAPAAIDYYKVDLKADQNVTILCDGEPFDSKLKPVLMLYDPAGHEIRRERRLGRLQLTVPESGTYLVRVNDLQFRGGKQFPYRLTVTERPEPERLLSRLSVTPGTLAPVAEAESGAPQKLTVPCEVKGEFYPRGDTDSYEFSAVKGDIYWIELVSDRLGFPTDPFVVVQKVGKNDKGLETVSDVQEMYDSDANLGGLMFNTSTRDPSWRLEAGEDSLYRLHIRDLFNTRSEQGRSYRLLVRRESPGFDLVALVLPPQDFNKDKREAQRWSSVLRRNETIAIKVLALRRDNFAGEIELHAKGLPPEVRASESVIAEGQNAAWISISATDKSADWFGTIQILGKAKVGSAEIESTARAASVTWDVPDYNNESVKSRLMQQQVLATISDAAPFSIDPGPPQAQAAQGAALVLPLKLQRSADFKAAVKLRAYVDGQNDPIKEWEVDGQASEAKFELDLKQSKLTDGRHQLYFQAQTAGKIKRLPSAQPSDVTAVFSSPVIKLVINPAPTAAR